jgi:hypothetical protein
MGAQLDGVFDPSLVAPVLGGGNALPVSDKNGHVIIITESEMKPTTSGTGTKLALTCQIQGGPHNGVEGEWDLNLGNANATTVRIAQTELSCICHAVGYVQALQNTEVLHNKPFRVVVELQKGQEAQEKGYVNVTKILRADGSKLNDKPGTVAQQSAPAPAPAFPQQPMQQPPQQSFPQQAPAQQFPVTNAVPMQQPVQQPMQQPPQQAWQQPQQPAQQMPQQQPPQAGPPTQVPWGQPPAQ